MKQKTLNQCFSDWFNFHYGYGYGTGDKPILNAIKLFFENFNKDSNSYDYKILTIVLGEPTTWFIINFMAKYDYIEYGTSPRYGWLTNTGIILSDYFKKKTVDELFDIVFNSNKIACFYDRSKPFGTDCQCNILDMLPCENPFFARDMDMDEMNKVKNDVRVKTLL